MSDSTIPLDEKSAEAHLMQQMAAQNGGLFVRP